MKAARFNLVQKIRDARAQEDGFSDQERYQKAKELMEYGKKLESELQTVCFVLFLLLNKRLMTLFLHLTRQ